MQIVRLNQRHKTSKDNLRNYVHWAEDAWLLFTVPVMSSSRKEQERNYKKVYFITLNQEKEFSDGRVKVHAVPAFKWLLAKPETGMLS